MPSHNVIPIQFLVSFWQSSVNRDNHSAVYVTDDQKGESVNNA